MTDTANLPEGAHADFRDAMSYGDYLRLDLLLAAQQPASNEHNELLFIIQHQATELWMKLALHELTAARNQIIADDLQPAFKMLSRVSRIMNNLIQAWDILSTLTPSEYSSFRESLGKSSGFQSHQNRSLEFLFGNKKRAMLTPFEHRPELHALLKTLLPKLMIDPAGMITASTATKLMLAYLSMATCLRTSSGLSRPWTGALSPRDFRLGYSSVSCQPKNSSGAIRYSMPYLRPLQPRCRP